MLKEQKPASMVEVAEVYGNLFADVHRAWLQALLAASLEAASGGAILTDEDPQHAEINSSINQQLRRHLYEPGTPTAVPDAVAVKLLNRTVSDTLSGKRGTIENLHLNAPGSPPRGMVLEEQPTASGFHVFLRGNPLLRGESVKAHFLTALSDAAPQPFADGRRRLDLVRAIVAEDNPLTRRVVVNWIWRNHFGVGLVRTPDDFGTRGTPPTHPELLDYLATALADKGWSIKQMHRLIMRSDVYQQGAVEKESSRRLDPDNHLLWRMPRHRLDMESMRDAMLAVTDELDTHQIGGRPFELESNPIVPRRSIYAFVNRDIISHLSSTFDGANPTSCTAKRPETTVPQQTLYALNSDFIQDRAAVLAKLAEAAVDGDTKEDDAARLDWLYQRLYGRSPDAQEVEMALAFLASQTPESQQVDLWSQLAHALLASNEFMFVD
ncbi:MAG: DUF1553 domain-containing protein [Pirellulaceae bacterium]